MRAMDTNANPTFVLFGWDHLVTMLVVAVVAIGLPLAARKAGQARFGRSIAAVLAVALVVHECFKIWAYVWLFDQPLTEHLPLHLCNVATFVMAYVLVRQSYSAYEIVYFWGLCGSLPALVTPDLQHGFPSLLYVMFFFGHALVVTGVIFATLVFEFRPTIRSMVKAIAVTCAYAAVIAPLNILLDANYLYLRHKPEQATVMDYLGPWPWYIAALMVIAVILCLICLTPFALLARKARMRQPRDTGEMDSRGVG